MLKKSSYHKLKAENARLKQDIYNIIEKQDQTTITRYKVLIQVEKAIWSGSSTMIAAFPLTT